MNKERILQSVDEHLAAHRFWRAREILQGVIGSCEYDPDIYEKYAHVLALMHDDLEAGKFFALAGRPSPDADRCIRLFFDRHANCRPEQLISQLPRRARFTELDRYPPPFREYFTEKNVDFNRLTEENQPRSKNRNAKFPMIIGMSIFFFILLLIIIGFVTLAKAVYEFTQSFF